jgi:hypothetical protein
MYTRIFLQYPHITTHISITASNSDVTSPVWYHLSFSNDFSLTLLCLGRFHSVDMVKLYAKKLVMEVGVMQINLIMEGSLSDVSIRSP